MIMVVILAIMFTVFHHHGWNRNVPIHPKLSLHGLTIHCHFISQDLMSRMHISKYWLHNIVIVYMYVTTYFAYTV